MKLGALALRGLIGGLFIGHGTQKLFGWFGGPGLEGASGVMEKLQLRAPRRPGRAGGRGGEGVSGRVEIPERGPRRRHALLAGAAEAGGGLLLTLGAFTPLATM